ncbi:Prephenate dehydratase [Halomicronema hongdechloris C2206]|uniref:Prephenate dehydratase n=1 Tax=Halomicronema hongdechloris C2206 TaxID=1641165 RepID=A0A1Z3HI75_9CYAN|nr:prephenate dehydratase [Halomicronema hongdechloris]ASC69973.1 Prephenate dehydratase [Halomicronema hongdechloris C2206]
MVRSVAHLGPRGTYSEMAALAYIRWAKLDTGDELMLRAYPSIAQALQATATGETEVTVVPVENSVEGSVAITLDMLWRLETLQIQKALVLPIVHAFLSRADRMQQVQTVYSHPQALGQCQGWIETQLPHARLIPTSSTTEALTHLQDDVRVGAIASEWAAQIYQLPVLAHAINDHADNCTKFWVLGRKASHQGNQTSLAFSLPINAPGALLKPLQILAAHDINMSRIESRPTKRSLGDYLFFIDIEADASLPNVKAALQSLKHCTETLKIFGSYSLLPIDNPCPSDPTTNTSAGAE